MSWWKKKPVIVGAVQWFRPGDHAAVEIPVWSHEGGCSCPECGEPLETHGIIKTLEGIMRVCPGDWIIRGIKGELYPCKPDIFAATYEPLVDCPCGSGKAYEQCCGEQ